VKNRIILKKGNTTQYGVYYPLSAMFRGLCVRECLLSQSWAPHTKTNKQIGDVWSVDPVVPRNEDGIVSGIGSNRLLFWRIAHHYLPLRELTRHYVITTAFRRVYMDHPAEVTLGGAHGSTTERGILGAAAISTQYSFDTHAHTQTWSI